MQTMPREQWTDDRLDDLSRRVDAGFTHVDQRFERVEGKIQAVDNGLHGVELELEAQRREISGLRSDMNMRLAEIGGRMDRLADDFASLNRILIGSALGLAITLIASRIPL